MDAGDILYIVITLVVVLVGIFKKKPEKPNAVPQYNPEAEEAFEPIYSERRVYAQPETLEVEVNVPEEEGKSYFAHKKAAKEKKKTEPVRKVSNPMQTLEVKKTGDTKLSQEFDAKKAIIYSIILERKKY